MANGKRPETTGEHIIALYGHVTGVKRDVDQIRCTQKQIHEDIEKLGGKVDKIYWVLLATVGTVAMFFFDKILK
jgi:hypothetical protein